MYQFAVIFLALFIALGVVGVVVAFTFPRKGVGTLSDKLKQKTFQRGALTISICSAMLAMLLTGVLNPREALIIPAGLLLLLEYGIKRTATYG